MNIYELAEKLHAKQCRWDHTEGCSWYYEKDDWTRWAHKRYLDMAFKVEADTDMPLGDIAKVIEAL